MSTAAPLQPRVDRRAPKRRSVASALAVSLVVAGLGVLDLVAATPAPAAPTGSPVTAAVDADDPSHHWRLGESADGPEAVAGADRAGASDLVVPASAVRGVPGASADGDAATAFAGGGAVVGEGSEREGGPQSFSLEVWLRTTDPGGGKILGFEDERSGESRHYDRHLWMGDDGRVSFGVYDGRTSVVRSAGGLDDGDWHHLVATYRGSVMRLFVDGEMVGERDGVTRAQPFAGFWRVGDGRLDGWPSPPAATAFTGDLDEVAVYDAPLSPERVAAHRAAVTDRPQALRPPAPPAPPGQGAVVRPTDFGSYRPDASTTGSYGRLTPHAGDLTITTPGQVVEGLDVSGVLRIKADGVTVRRTTVRGGDRGPEYRGAILMALEGDQRGAVIEDVTVRPSHPVVGMNAVQVSSATVRRADISRATDGILVYGDDVTLVGNYVHHLVHYPRDPSQRDGSHDDAVQVEGGSRTSIVGNSLSSGHNAGIQVTQNHARVRDLLIDRNHLGGGYLTVNTSEKGKGPYSGFRMTDNRFAGDERNGDGVQAAITGPTRDAATIRGNVVATTGKSIRVVDADS